MTNTDFTTHNERSYKKERELASESAQEFQALTCTHRNREGGGTGPPTSRYREGVAELRVRQYQICYARGGLILKEKLHATP